jgi:hypothetical protein
MGGDAAARFRHGDFDSGLEQNCCHNDAQQHLNQAKTIDKSTARRKAKKYWLHKIKKKF